MLTMPLPSAISSVTYATDTSEWTTIKSDRKAVEISEENLEDLLAYDDLFLDYFNAFLSLPTFPVPLYYNRLTGTFLEVENENRAAFVAGLERPGLDELGEAESAVPASPPYGATDEERDRMLEWAREERLPLFLRTQLFREFKLCKLLLRPLDERNSASRGGSTNSRALRGYSRQTQSYVSSLSNSADNSANDVDDLDDDVDDEGDGGSAGARGRGETWTQQHKSALYKYARPGSNAYSLPPRLAYGQSFHLSAGLTYTKKSQSKESEDETSESKDLTTYSATSKAKDRLPLETKKGRGTEDDDDQSIPPPTGARDEVVQAPISREVTFNDQRDQVFSQAAADNLSAKSTRRSRSSRHSSSLRKDPAGEAIIPAVIEDYDAAFGEAEPPPGAMGDGEGGIGAGEAYVTFGDDTVSEQQTETDMRHLESRHNMSVHQMKEHVLGSVLGMEQLREFLQSTTGHRLLHFWLDCEFYKDAMEEFDDEENMAIRNRLFRDIQDKYRLVLAPEALRSLAHTASNTGLSHTIFLRTQYNVLRRLRAYWVPRFLIHKERSNQLSLEFPLLHPAGGYVPPDSDTSSTTASCFFPSISVVCSLPVRPDDVVQAASTDSWNGVRQAGRCLDSRVRSAKHRRVGASREVKKKTLADKLVRALMADKAAGGPFRMFLERQENGKLLSKLLFWEDVTEYGEAESRAADRLLRMTHAWGIFNTYIAPDARYNIGIMPDDRDLIHRSLLQNTDFVQANILQEAKSHAVKGLETPWIRFLKEDMKTFYDCHVRNSGTPPSTADAFEVILDDDEDVLICRARPWTKRYPSSTGSERGRRLRSALSMADSIDEVRRIELRRRRQERRAMMEKERKKAVRAAKQRLKEQKYAARNPNWRPKKKEGENGDSASQHGDGDPADLTQDMDSMSHHSHATSHRTGVSRGSKASRSRVMGSRSAVNPMDDVSEAAEQAEEKRPTYAQSHSNKGLNAMFKKFVVENEAKEIQNVLNLCLDIDAYNALPDGKKDQKKKDLQAHNIQKTYMEQGAKKKVPLSDRVNNKLKSEKDRPKSGTLKDAQNFVQPQIEEAFARFWTTQASEPGMDGKSMANMSKVELAMRSDDLGTLKAWRKGKKNTNVQDGRAQPTREDKVEFVIQLSQASSGVFPPSMLYFYKYLVKHGEDDGMPLIDKDLVFYCEVQKFKDCSHGYSDEEMLKRKVTCLLESFLESASPPALQIDISQEQQQKCIRAAQKYLTGKEISPNIFDEAQYHVFKELLPYWAGFQKAYKPDDDGSKKPRPVSTTVTKHQKDRIRRLEEMEHWQPPPAKTFTLPIIPKGATVAAFSFSLNEGVKWKDVFEMDPAEDEVSSLAPPPPPAHENSLPELPTESTISLTA